MVITHSEQNLVGLESFLWAARAPTAGTLRVGKVLFTLCLHLFYVAAHINNLLLFSDVATTTIKRFLLINKEYL